MASNNTSRVVKWKWVPPIVPPTSDMPQNSAQVASRIHPYHPDKLPPFSERPQSTTTFTFIPVVYEKDIDPFNCVVFGPDYKTRHASITTSAYVTTIVLFSIVDGKSVEDKVASIKWDDQSVLEFMGEEQLTSRYLELSSDRVYRDMVIGAEVYVWMPRRLHGIYLFRRGGIPFTECARLTVSSSHKGISLEMTNEALEAGLFNHCVFSTILLFSRRKID